MPMLSDIVKVVRSGVFHVVYLDATQKRIGSGTAFTAKGLLVTNGHVFDVPRATEGIWLRQDGHRDPATEGVYLRRTDFEARRIVASPSSEYDYAALDIPELRQFNPHQFQIADHSGRMVGEHVAFLGYPLEHQNLTCHAGIVASFYRRQQVDIVQIDASVNPSNSGGPLFDPLTGIVFGIVTRKATGLTDMFTSLREAVNANISTMSLMQGGILIDGISLKDALITGQNQILATLEQIERSSNVGIGYAFSCKHILEEREFSNRI